MGQRGYITVEKFRLLDYRGREKAKLKTQNLYNVMFTAGLCIAFSLDVLPSKQCKVPTPL
jgi:hypothetical protein